MRPLLIYLILSFFTLKLSAQIEDVNAKKESKGTIFFYWGYNRSFFSKTNLHFSGPNYDFTLYGLKGADRPSKFGTVYFKPSSFSVPQYNYRMGYMITNRLALSLGVDHMKYVVEQDQATRISGVITSEASTTYAGTYLHDSIVMSKDLLMFEHTNGFNLVSLEFEFLQPVFLLPDYNLAFQWNTGLGGIWVVTKTDVKVMGDGLDNDYHVAGFAMVAKTGPRIEYKGRYFILGELKGGYASLPSVLIKNAAPEIGDHTLTFLEYYIAVGFRFRIFKSSID